MPDIVVKFSAPYVKRCDLYSVHIQTHTHKHTYSEKTEEEFTFFSMAHMVECSLTMWEVLGSKHSWVCFLLLLMLEPFFLSSENDAKLIFSKKLTMSIARYRGKIFSSIRQTVWPVQSWQTYTHTHTYILRKNWARPVLFIIRSKIFSFVS